MGEKVMNNLLLSMASLLGAGYSNSAPWYTQIVKTVIDWLQMLLWPIIIIVATAGMIYAIYLGIQLARAESADKREEAKKRMLWFILAFVLTVLILVVIQLLISNFDAIQNLITSGVDGTTSSSTPQNP